MILSILRFRVGANLLNAYLTLQDPVTQVLRYFTFSLWDKSGLWRAIIMSPNYVFTFIQKVKRQKRSFKI